MLFSLRINNLITYTFVIILTGIGERLDMIARINPIMPVGNTYPSKKQNLGFRNQVKCLKKSHKNAVFR